MYTSEWRDRRRRQPHNVFSIQLRQNSQKKPTISGQITLFFVSIKLGHTIYGDDRSNLQFLTVTGTDVESQEYKIVVIATEFLGTIQ